jgi:hypothetical protein
LWVIKQTASIHSSSGVEMSPAAASGSLSNETSPQSSP